MMCMQAFVSCDCKKHCGCSGWIPMEDSTFAVIFADCPNGPLKTDELVEYREKYSLYKRNEVDKYPSDPW